MTSLGPSHGPARGSPQVVLVETADALPGLLPFQAWDAMATAEAIYVRDPAAHPAAEHLHFAGLDLVALEPAALGRDDLDLARPGDPGQRRLAKSLLRAAADHGRVVYLLGPDDGGFQQVVSLASPDYDAEIEIVFYVPQPQGTELLRLVEIMARLRDPDGGCPWDLEQDHASLGSYLLEEAYELLDAVDDGIDAAIAEELGDVLLQVVFHAQVADDRRAFSIEEVARGIADKLVRRHPHVFAEGDASTPDEVQTRWDELKRDEKPERTGPFDGVPTALPALALTRKLHRRASRLGFDWPDADEAWAKVREELDELSAATSDRERAAEVGDVFNALTRLADHLGVDPEQATRRSAQGFRRRFEAACERARQEGLDLEDVDAATWQRLWEQVKAAEPDGEQSPVARPSVPSSPTRHE